MLGVLKNKVVIYLVSRYSSYGIQFLTSLVIASKLGPYYMGVWGFILLLLNYLGQLHLGVHSSLQILLIQNKDDERKCQILCDNSLFIVAGLSIIIFLFWIYTQLIGIDAISHYGINNYVVLICIIAVLQNFNNLLINVFRVKNLLNIISATQFVIVLAPFVCVIIFSGKALLNALVWSYVISNFICVLYCFKKWVYARPNVNNFNIGTARSIVSKGIFLYILNVCISLIVLSLRTIVGSNYSIESFGYFTFAFTLGQAVMTLMESIAFIFQPKVLSSYNTKVDGMTLIRINETKRLYMSASHLIYYIVIPFLPLISYLLPEYAPSVPAFNIIGLALVLNSNNFAHSAFLLAKNKERVVAGVSLVGLIVNIIVAMALVHLHVDFWIVPIATLISYLVISYLTFRYVYFYIGEVFCFNSLKVFFPISLLLPYIIAVITSLIHVPLGTLLPIIVFAILNYKTIKDIVNVVIRIFRDSNVVNV